MSNKHIPILVDADVPPGKPARSSLERALAAVPTKLLDMELNAVSAQLGERLTDLREALSTVETSVGGYELDSVSFTLAITATGKVALLSTIEGSAAPHVGLQFTLRKTDLGNPDESK